MRDIWNPWDQRLHDVGFLSGRRGSLERGSLGCHAHEKGRCLLSFDQKTAEGRGLSAGGLGRRLGECFLQCDVRESAEGGREDADSAGAAVQTQGSELHAADSGKM